MVTCLLWLHVCYGLIIMVAMVIGLLWFNGCYGNISCAIVQHCSHLVHLHAPGAVSAVRYAVPMWGSHLSPHGRWEGVTTVPEGHSRQHTGSFVPVLFIVINYSNGYQDYSVGYK